MQRRFCCVLCLLCLVCFVLPSLAIGEEAQMARAGDPTAHGIPISGAGSPNVLICGQPAWRAQVDLSSCPLYIPGTQPLPHIGGYVAVGSSNVLINGYPAAYMGCTIIEANGVTNTIVSGCPTVLCGK